jgi:hypothetical protein
MPPENIHVLPERVAAFSCVCVCVCVCVCGWCPVIAILIVKRDLTKHKQLTALQFLAWRAAVG